MRPGLAALLLAFFSTAAAADWTAVSEGDEIYAPFADLGTLRRAGAMARMSVLYDFRHKDFTPQGLPLFSTVVLREYDCAQRRVRLLSSIDFSGHMGEGAVADSSNVAGRWEEVVAGSGDEAFWNLACGPAR